MNNPYFVMLNNQAGTRVVPLCEENGELAMFPTVDAAIESAMGSVYGMHFGFEVFEVGAGVA